MSTPIGAIYDGLDRGTQIHVEVDPGVSIEFITGAGCIHGIAMMTREQVEDLIASLEVASFIAFGGP